MRLLIKKFSTLIILAIFWAIPFTILYLIVEKIGIVAIKYVPSLYFVFLITSILYKQYWSLKIFNNKRGTIKFLSIFSVSLIIFMYLNTLVYRSYKLYEYLVADKKRGWEGIAHQPDDTLGFKPIPNSKAYHTFPIGDKIPMAYNSNGFRIPLSDTVIKDKINKADLMFLGCSFTYGDACYAEETFPYLVAKETNLSYINAGVCSYGLAHMLILAEKLIPKYKPKYIIVQYSEWLAGRGLNMYAPAYYAFLPNPYFSEKNNIYTLEYPAFKSQAFILDSKQIKSSYNGNFIKFCFEKGLLFYLKEDWFFQKNKMSILIGQRRQPAKNLIDVEKYAYNRIKAIAEKNGTTVIILNLGNFEYSKKSHNLFSDTAVHFAEADSTLIEYLKTRKTNEYSKEFNLWRFNGKDSILVDPHPNSNAHRLIAKSIIKELNELINKKPH